VATLDRVGTNGFFTDLAGYARAHPGCALERWWSAARCQQMGAFADDDHDVHVRTYTPTSRPDGHGIWAEHGRQVPFFLEFDAGTERPLSRLVEKIDGYVGLARVTGHVWPVLFSLHSAVRERHLHQQLAAAGIRYPVATLARDRTNGATPAEAVWWPHRHHGTLRRLVDLDVPGRDAGPTILDGGR
jgi:Replication-relaxation